MIEILLDEGANGSTVEARLGDIIVIRLEENPTTGYAWSLERIDGDAAVAEDPEFHGPSDVPGAGGERVFGFQVAGQGEARISLVLARPWQQAGPPARRMQVEVRVLE